MVSPRGATHRNATPAPTWPSSTPRATILGAVHGFGRADASGTKSTACIACHGKDLPLAHDKSCVCHTNSRYRAEMTPLLAAGAAECVDCHKGTHAAHGFEMTASG